MTKTEAQAYVRRIREDLREFERAMSDNDAQWMAEAIRDAAGAAGEIESALCDSYGDGKGVGGILLEPEFR